MFPCHESLPVYHWHFIGANYRNGISPNDVTLPRIARDSVPAPDGPELGWRLVTPEWARADSAGQHEPWCIRRHRGQAGDGGAGARYQPRSPGPGHTPGRISSLSTVSHGAAWWWSPAWDYSGLELGAGERLRDYSDHWSWIITWGQVTGPRVSATRGEIRPGLAGTDQMSNVDAVQCLHNSGNSLTLSNGNFTVWIGVLDDFLRFSNPNCCLESRQRM